MDCVALMRASVLACHFVRIFALTDFLYFLQSSQNGRIKRKKLRCNAYMGRGGKLVCHLVILHTYQCLRFWTQQRSRMRGCVQIEMQHTIAVLWWLSLNFWIKSFLILDIFIVFGS